MGGFFTRFRVTRNAEVSPSDSGHDGLTNGDDSSDAAGRMTKAQIIGEVEEQPAGGSLPEKVTSADLPAEGNDVAIESTEISHEGLELDDGQGSGVAARYTMFNSAGEPLRLDDDGPTTLTHLSEDDTAEGNKDVVLKGKNILQNAFDEPDTDDNDPDLDDPD